MVHISEDELYSIIKTANDFGLKGKKIKHFEYHPPKDATEINGVPVFTFEPYGAAGSDDK